MWTCKSSYQQNTIMISSCSRSPIDKYHQRQDAKWISVASALLIFLQHLSIKQLWGSQPVTCLDTTTLGQGYQLSILVHLDGTTKELILFAISDAQMVS